MNKFKNHRSPLSPRSGDGSAGGEESRAIAGSDAWITSPSLSGVIVTEETAPRLGVAYSCINVLSSDVATVPFQVVRREPGGGRSVDTAHNVHDLVFHSPDGEMSANGWIGSQTWHLNTHGNAYTKIERDRHLRPAELILLDPRKVRSARSKDGKLYYDVQGEVVLHEDMIHIANVGFNGIDGKSPVRECMEAFGLTMGVEKFGASYFGNGANAKGIISTANKLDQVERDQLRKEINDQHQGVYNAHRFMLLSGATFTPTTIPADEAQFIATRKFQVAEICRIFRVPPSKVMDLERANFANLEEVNLDYYDSSLKPWIRRFESQFLRKLFTRAERQVYSIEHDVSQLLKGRVLDRANADKIYREMGAINSDEIRARQGLPPIAGGKTYLIPLNLAPLDKVAAASIETLKGVKDALPPPPEPRALPAPVPTVPALVDGTKGQREPLLEAGRRVIEDVARRMSRREANILRKIFRSEDLSTLCADLDAHYSAELGTLANALEPSLDLYARASGTAIDPTAFASTAIASARAEILKCIEGPATRAALASLVDRWELQRPPAIVSQLPR